MRRVMFKGIWPTSPRDFLGCTTWRPFPDGSVIIATRSPRDSLKHCPEASGYVRGSILISGYLIQPAEVFNNPSVVPPGHVKVTLQAHTELGGTLPTGIINSLSSAAPLKIVNTIADILSK